MTPDTEQQLKAAQVAADQADWSTAASLFETVYQTAQSYALNLQLVTALVATQKYTLASAYAAEYEPTYLATDAAASLYLTALLESHQFIKARMAAELRVAQTDWYAQTLAQITAAETLATTTLQQTLKTTMRQFYHMSDQPVAAQNDQLLAAQHLTYAQYVTAAKFLLIDPFLHQLSRVEVLYTLRALGVATTVQFLWLDETRLAVIPSALPAMGQDSGSRTVQHALQQQFAQTDVTMFENLQAVLSLQLMYLYPETEKIMTDAQLWLTLLLAAQTGTVPRNLTVTGQKMLDIQQQIQQLNLDFAQ
ncbi:hypothetical protein C5Z25_01890 [Lactobacillus sp. CBA3605]|uniref:hypothetical protein n=1 Tax=Lactobacillus sp. CBA3605 TaxID=2099788 RepID=UPI000CFB9FDC|nr:hypothetical protein [Lactobacillus sp. CBA3605]AVK60597.1 hypothetical protein C5Z25_01890 [Lactobacillus sp. CBA3605]